MRRGAVGVFAVAAAVATPLRAPAQPPMRVERKQRIAHHVERGRPLGVRRYADSSTGTLPQEVVWRPMCGSQDGALTAEDLKVLAEASRALSEEGAFRPLSQAGGATVTAAGPDIVFNISPSVPAQAVTAIRAVEAYLESQFSDPVTVGINVSFASLSPGVLGGTGNSYVSESWSNVRDALQAGMNGSDTIHDFLPAGPSIPVRYDGFTDVVTNENRCFVSIANYLAAIGFIGGTAASMTFNTNFSWDYTPPNISSGSFDFQSVLVHEVGHVLGFTSGVDFRNFDIEMLDIFRFQRSDGAGTDYNPDTFEEFQSTPRLADKDAPGTDDDVISDLITIEYRMSDGSPRQASHFHDQSPPIGIMDPTFGSGQTFYPDFFQSSDLNMLDAIGWDRPANNFSCESAVELECNHSLLFDNLMVTNAPDPLYTCGLGDDHDGTRWFKFEATDRSARISTCGSSAPDSTWAVYAGECGALSEVACAEDVGCVNEPFLGDLCVTGLRPGQTYYLQVSARTSGTRGIYRLQLECSCPGACCADGGSCIETRRAACEGGVGTFLGPESVCAGDGNADDIDDACEVDPACLLDAAMPDETAVPMNRMIPLIPANPGTQTALRVRMVSLEHPDPPNSPGAPPQDFFAWEGETRWVGAPQVLIDNTVPATEYLAAALECTPVCRDWGSMGLVYVYGAEILPSSLYEIQAVDCSCDNSFELNFADDILVSTGRWGDVSEPFSEPGGPTQPTFIDIGQMVNKFKSRPEAIFKGQALLQPNRPLPTEPVSFIDIGLVVSAFKGLAYPLSGPCACPAQVLCGQACNNDDNCPVGICLGNQCRDACGRCTP